MDAAHRTAYEDIQPPDLNLAEIERLVRMNPAQALDCLDLWKASHFEASSDEEKARYYLLMSVVDSSVAGGGNIIRYATESYAYAHKCGHRRLQVQACLSTGVGHFHMSDYAAAVQSYTKAMELCAAEDVDLHVRAITNLANVSIRLGDFESAIQYIDESITLAESISDQVSISRLFANKAHILYDRGFINEGIELTIRSLEIRRQIGDAVGVSQCLNNLSNWISDDAEALKYLLESIKLAEEIGEKERLPMSYARLARYYFSQNDIQVGELYLKKVDETFPVLELNKVSRTTVRIILSEAELQRKDYSAALRWLELAEQEAKEARYLRLHATLLEKKCDILDLQGRPEDALRVARQLIMLQRSIGEAELDKKVSVYRASWELEQTRERAKLLHEKNEQLEKVNLQLTQLLNDRSELLEIAAHDLKNPLGSALLLTELMMEGEVSIAELGRYAGEIRGNISRMLDIIKSLLQLKEYESDILKVENELFPPSVALLDAAAQCRRQADTKDIEIRIEVRDSSTVNTDRTLLTRVCENLISNAVKFSHPCSLVELSTYEDADGACCVVEVKDHGPGIPECEQHLLFKRFARLSTKPTGGEHSTGLGLYIVRSIVEKLGWSIDFTSAEQAGTTFFLKIPIESQKNLASRTKKP